MNFRRKVKAIVEAKKKKLPVIKKVKVPQTGQTRINKILADLKKKYPDLDWGDKSKPKTDLAHTEIPFREKVKDILEADLRPRRPGKRTQFQINRDHQRRDQHDKGRTEGGRTGQARLTGHYDANIKRPQDAAASLRRAALQKMNLVTMYSPTGRKSQGLQVVRDSDDHKLALKHGFAESSNHPFYQKVKALSRGRKNNSLLEKKSKTIKLLIGRIKPCGEKSKTDEGFGSAIATGAIGSLIGGVGVEAARKWMMGRKKSKTTTPKEKSKTDESYESTRKWQPGDEPKQTGREPATTPASDKAFKKRQKKFLAGIKKTKKKK